jgi:aquaporin Z
MAAANWPEYFMEAANLGLFMVSACIFGTVLEHPDSTLHGVIEDPFVRRALMGLAMGITAIGIICSPFGKRSGAHMNPAVTLTYFRLGRIPGRDAAYYLLFQFAGGVAGVALAAVLIGPALAHSAVNYVATTPGPSGPAAAFVAEFAISYLLMLTLLVVSNVGALSRYTPYVAGLLVATYITFEAPISGMSMNPARTFGSALVAGDWYALWIYFVAPPLGMILAGQFYLMRWGAQRVFCAKLHHHNPERCIFRCNYGAIHDA